MKIKELLEGVGRITSYNQTDDVGPNEIKKQAAKFGFKVDKDGYPPVISNGRYAKNSTPNKLMNLGLNEAEDPKLLQKNIITTVRQTTDTRLLQKVLDTLKLSGFEDNLIQVLSTDVDAKKYLEQIASIVTKTEGTDEDKNNFIENFKKGFINTKKMLDGKPHALSDIIENPFALNVFLRLSPLKEQGVGPGEIALGILSPDIKWVGQKGGGGDIIVDGKKVEVKARLAEGGRWFDARKANRDEQEIKRSFAKLGIELGNILNVNGWINYRETNPTVKKNVKQLAKIIAESNFKYVNTSELVKELISGDRNSIELAFLKSGYENYKSYSQFDGMMLLDVGGGNALQYFNDFDSMKDKIKWGTIYLVSPSSDAMPKVILDLKSSGLTSPSVKSKATTLEPVNKDIPIGRKPAPITARNPKLTPTAKGVGRSKRK